MPNIFEAVRDQDGPHYYWFDCNCPDKTCKSKQIYHSSEGIKHDWSEREAKAIVAALNAVYESE
jgi:hypothetical protein